jgi:predicted nucleic acid-binding protein
MVSFLVDTNVLAELRKRPRANAALRSWLGTLESEIYLSVLTIGEIRRGVDNIRRRDEHAPHASIAGFAGWPKSTAIGSITQELSPAGFGW